MDDEFLTFLNCITCLLFYFGLGLFAKVQLTSKSSEVATGLDDASGQLSGSNSSSNSPRSSTRGSSTSSLNSVLSQKLTENGNQSSNNPFDEEQEEYNETQVEANAPSQGSAAAAVVTHGKKTRPDR